VPAELTYGIERLVAFLQDADSIYDIEWTPGFTYRQVRFADEQQFSVYNFEVANVERLWQLFDLHEKECQELLDKYKGYPDKSRFPVLAAYDQVLKCSHLFNLLDSRGAISVTERVAVIGRVRRLAVGVAQLWNQSEMAAEAAQ
jgi:glycyl-tRNA synthetase alpha chain